jgi:hypothetical protein
MRSNPDRRDARPLQVGWRAAAEVSDRSFANSGDQNAFLRARRVPSSAQISECF